MHPFVCRGKGEQKTKDNDSCDDGNKSEKLHGKGASPRKMCTNIACKNTQEFFKVLLKNSSRV
jgi:hypothetical protein